MQWNLPFHRMVTNFIMAESACKQLVAACSNKFAVPFVVLTTINLLLLISIWRNTSRYTGTISTLFWIWFRQLLLSSYPAADMHKIVNIYICKTKFIETFRYQTLSWDFGLDMPSALGQVWDLVKPFAPQPQVHSGSFEICPSSQVWTSGHFVQAYLVNDYLQRTKQSSVITKVVHQWKIKGTKHRTTLKLISIKDICFINLLL